MDSTPRLLEVANLRTHFFTEDGVVKAVDGVSFSIGRGEVLGLVGESGCGKSVTSLSIMRLIGHPGRIIEGVALLEGQDLFELPKSEMEAIRGKRISIIFQQPQSALNPVFRVGHQISEALLTHERISRATARRRAEELLRIVGVADVEQRARSYPHELSGGMAQRVMIAMALACTPNLLIADEPTTALDVTIQAQILDLLRDLRNRTGAAILLITHDLGVVAEIAERVAVMYAGRIVEEADVKSLFSGPMHPYSRGLMASIPVLGQVKDQLEVIPGSVPNLIDLPPGCHFAPRCTARVENNLTVCDMLEPELRMVGRDHTVRCWLYHDSPNHRAPLGPRATSSSLL